MASPTSTHRTDCHVVAFRFAGPALRLVVDQLGQLGDASVRLAHHHMTRRQCQNPARQVAAALMELELLQRPDQAMALVGILEVLQHPAHLVDTRRDLSEASRLPAEGGYELVVLEGDRAGETRPRASGQNVRDAPDVVVVPVRGHQEPDGPGGIDVQGLEVVERRHAARLHARVDHHPLAHAQMDQKALAVSGTEGRELDLVRRGRRQRLSQVGRRAPNQRCRQPSPPAPCHCGGRPR